MESWIKKHIQVFLTIPPVCPAGCPSGSCSPMWIQGRRWRGSWGPSPIVWRDTSWGRESSASMNIPPPSSLIWYVLHTASCTEPRSLNHQSQHLQQTGGFLKICFGCTNLEKRDRSLMLDGSRAKRWQSCSSKTRKLFSLAQRFKLRSVPYLTSCKTVDLKQPPKKNQRA